LASILTGRLADNQRNLGNGYTGNEVEIRVLRSVASAVSSVVCVKMMVLKIRLETDEWIYEEHETA
tara:strand:- start:222 stop:419 length:198 start_codon:yes stop_codon:yes gene_type:complete